MYNKTQMHIALPPLDGPCDSLTKRNAARRWTGDTAVLAGVSKGAKRGSEDHGDEMKAGQPSQSKRREKKTKKEKKMNPFN